jgi:hypothetical protein
LFCLSFLPFLNTEETNFAKKKLTRNGSASLIFI